MRLRIASLSLLAICIATGYPAMAGDAYDNGPANGNVDAWGISDGFQVSNSITCCKVFDPSRPGTITGMSFYAWLVPGDTISSVQITLGTTPFGSNLFNGFVNMTQSGCSTNNFGFNVCLESGNFLGPTTIYGNYWVTLQNAMTPTGDPVYWDQNSGVGCTSPGCPSVAQQNTVGTIPSEAFTLYDSNNTTSTGTGSTPEPASLLLLGSGALSCAGFLVRKIKR